MGPPRPCAIATLMLSDDELPGVQTLLYSIKAHLPSTEKGNSKSLKLKNKQTPLFYYPPEIIVFIASTISKSARETLDTFSTRYIEIHTTHYSLGKFHIFSQQVYNQIVFIDLNCLVQKDISHLCFIENNDEKERGNNIQNNGFITAPNLKLGDGFDSNVMVVKPSIHIFNDIMTQVNTKVGNIVTNSNSFLNQYFQSAWMNLAIESRLDSKYNTQVNDDMEDDSIVDMNQVMIWNYNNNNNEIDVRVQWWKVTARSTQNNHHRILQLYNKWYTKSKVFQENYKEQQQLLQKSKQDTINKLKLKQKQNSSKRQAPPNEGKRKQKENYNAFYKRFKELRKEGKSSSDAMSIARSEHGIDEEEKNESNSAQAQVARMFGF